MNNIPHDTINAIITNIYEAGLKINYSKYQDNQLLSGYYLQSKYRDNITYEELALLPQLERVFINIKSKAKRVYGPTNQSDFENQWGEALLYLYEALYDVFSNNNPKVEESLIVHTIDDIHHIISDEKLASKLCRYCITYVDRCFKTLLKLKSNPDYYYSNKKNNKGFIAVNYLYLDNDNDDNNPYDELDNDTDSYTPDTGDLTQYIMDNYFGLLTPKQQLFTQCYLWFDKDPQGHISTEDGIILYNKQEAHHYRQVIAKKLYRLMAEANDTMLYINNYDRLDLNWKGDK